MSAPSRRVRNRVTMGCLLWFLGACQAEPPSSAASLPPSAEPTPGVSDVEPPEAPSPAPAPAEAPAPVDNRVHDACAKLCERKATVCPSYKDDVCRADCDAHVAKSKGCEAQVADALTCQAAAKQLPCSNVAAGSCTDVFLKMQRCHAGESSTPEAPKSVALPAGWKRFTDDTWAVSFTMPAEAALDTSAPSRTWKASLDGADYEARELARPKKLADNDFIKLVIAHVGVACQQNMRVMGRVDNADAVSMLFETGCGKGPRLHGKVRVDATRAISFLVRGPATDEQRETFFDGVR